MALEQSIDLALAATIGEGGVAEEALDRALAAVDAALVRLRDDDESGRLPLLHMPRATEDLASIRQAARWLRDDASDIVILGTGGSSLGGQTLAQLRDYAVPGAGRFTEAPRVHFLDNLDPVTFDHVLHRLPLASTRFVAISKSGGTGETLMQTIAVLSALDRAGLKARPGELFYGLSEPRGQAASQAAGTHCAISWSRRACPSSITTPGSAVAIRSSRMWASCRPPSSASTSRRSGRAPPMRMSRSARAGRPRDVPSALGAALSVAAALDGRGITVMKAYADRLERYTRWWVQLWAESLGKEGKGTQPVAAIGPVDQHSQLQLYLAGPNDKLFTVVTTGVAGQGPMIDERLARRAGEPGFAGKRIGDLVAAQGRATADTLARNGRPTRRIHIERLDERALGELLMHTMLETILAGYALGVDPFDQPAVEEGKILAKQYLAEA